VAWQFTALDLEKNVSDSEKRHHAQEGDCVNAGQSLDMTPSDPENGGAQQEESNDDAVAGVTPLILSLDVYAPLAVSVCVFWVGRA